MHRLDKRDLLTQLAALLEEELETVRRSVRAASEAATHSEAKPENKYDTRGLEASYLAGAQQERASALEAALALVRGIVPVDFGPDARIAATAVIEAELGGVSSAFFIAPVGAGSVLRAGDREVQVVTPRSPLGLAFLGRRVGDVATIRTPQGSKDYEIIGVW